MFAKFSVKKPLTVFVAVVLVIILGFVSFSNMTPDLLPSINLPYVMVITACPGQSPEEVEDAVTKPMEQAMASLENISDISSTSSENSSTITLQFEDDADMGNVVSDIREKINGVSGAWDDTVGTPYILKINPDLMPVAVSALQYDGMDNIELTSFLDDEIMSSLEGISGVASVSVSGNVEQKINVIISQDKIDALNRKMRAKIDDGFSDAEKEIADGEQEIADGKSQLDSQSSTLDSTENQLQSGQDTLINQSSSAQSQLIDQKITLEMAKSQLQAQVTEAQSNLNTLVSAEASLSRAIDQYNSINTNIDTLNSSISGLTELKNGYDALAAQKTALEEQIAALEASGTEADLQASEALKPQLEALNTQLDSLTAQISAAGTTAEGLSDFIVSLQTNLDSLNSAKSTMESTFSDMGVDPADPGASLTEMQNNIAQLQGGIDTLNENLTELENGTTTVDAAMTELSRQQSSGMLQISRGMAQISSARVQLSNASSQLDSAQEQIDTAKDQLAEQKEGAYDSANISISMQMVNQILTAENFSMPAGYVSEDGTDYLVRVGDKIEDVDEMKDLLIMDTGDDGIGEIHLSDLADVFVTDNSADTYAKIDGEDGVLLSFSKQSTYASATVSDNIAAEMKELTEKYDGLHFVNLYDSGDYIHIVVNSVLENLILGALLAILILFFFLKDIRPTAVIACSIPISLMFAIVLMYFSGVTLNIISLSGLAVGVGMLVDNSVVVIENIYRMRSLGESAARAAVKGTIQVTGAVVASTLTTVCVFLPIVFVSGLTRQIFTDLALTIAYSLLASLIVAITLVPAMSSGTLRNAKIKEHKLFDRFLGGYEKLARKSLKHKWIVIAASLVLLVGSMLLLVSRGFIFMPSMSGQQLSISVTAPEDSSFEDIKTLGNEVMERVSSIEDIETVGAIANGGSSSSAGGGMMSMMGGGGGDITMYAILRDNASMKDAEISTMINEKCADLDCTVSAQGASDMSSYMSAMGGSGISITLYGDDNDELIAQSEAVAEKLSQVEGVDTVSSGTEDATPEIRITVDKNKAMKKGLTVAQVYQSVAAGIATETDSTSVNVEGDDTEVVIQDEKNSKMDIAAVKAMSISYTDAASGDTEEVKLSDIASISETKSLSSISRDNQRRYLTITGTVKEGYNITNVTNAVSSAFSAYDTPEGISLEVGGESSTIMDSVEQLLYMLLLAVVIIYLIMVAQFQSFKSPFIVMFTIPLAFTGGFIALLLCGMELSVVSLVGFVMLSGIIVNNGIVLIDYINQLRLAGMEKKEAIIEAGKTRMRPILMTALTTIIGLLFMALGTGMGSELMQPMAIVCIGGLTYATIMTLFVVPAMYDIFSRKEMRKVDLGDIEKPEDEESV